MRRRTKVPEFKNNDKLVNASKNLGKYFYNMRKQKQLTLEKFSKLFNINANTYYSLEQGKIVYLPISFLEKIKENNIELTEVL